MQRGFSIILILVICLVLLLVGISGYFIYKQQFTSNQPQDMSVTSSPQLKSNIPVSSSVVQQTVPAGYKQFKGDGFTFNYPDSMSIESQDPTLVTWGSEYTPDQTLHNQMMLYIQQNPFVGYVKGDQLSLKPSSGGDDTQLYTIESVDENKEVSTNGIKATKMDLNCGPGCYYHILDFKVGEMYYELMMNGAGGGLDQKFDDIISSITLVNS